MIICNLLSFEHKYLHLLVRWMGQELIHEQLVTLFSRQILLKWYILYAVIFHNSLLENKCLVNPMQ
jgi:hypothetical protein